jgi:nicotinamide mononucleotide adenylyltransferase
MKKYLAQAAFKSSDSEVKYSMYIGRWQPWHQGHRWLIDQRLNNGKNVLICIRDIEPDEKNPWTAQEVVLNLNEELKDLIQEGKVKVIIIPDIESVNIGRGVGYDIIEHIPPDEIREVSATKIRAQMKQDGKL